MNKKGIFNPVEIMFYIMVVIIVAVFIALAISKFTNEKIDTVNLETFLLERKLIDSDSCLAYKDDLKIYLGIVALEKVNSERLKSCFTKENFGFLITILDLDGNAIKSAKNLDNRQEAYLPICSTIKGYKCIKKKDLIQYKTEQGIKTGEIQIEVIKLV